MERAVRAQVRRAVAPRVRDSATTCRHVHSAPSKSRPRLSSSARSRTSSAAVVNRRSGHLSRSSSRSRMGLSSMGSMRGSPASRRR